MQPCASHARTDRAAGRSLARRRSSRRVGCHARQLRSHRPLFRPQRHRRCHRHRRPPLSTYNKPVINRVLRPRCCHLESYYKPTSFSCRADRHAYRGWNSELLQRPSTRFSSNLAFGSRAECVFVSVNQSVSFNLST